MGSERGGAVERAGEVAGVGPRTSREYVMRSPAAARIYKGDAGTFTRKRGCLVKFPRVMA
ncbi:MAG: hypothetical protein A2Y38_24665 [Spirochaetes bacterium GWB1_59_5]|nr:MAG: hypothetical protein A2Y38_24665 [Spirochaetes bacterium GWB1_59_5]